MSDKNVQIRMKNGENWDSLFPKTKAALVETESGDTVEKHIKDVVRHITGAERNNWNSKATIKDIDARINALVSAAPSALDTLKEIAEALNNDPKFAATMTNILAKKVDKVSGKGLSSNDFTTALKQKLERYPETPYAHPSSHPASMIAQDADHRFCTDSQKSTWNNKSKVCIGKTPLTGADIWFEEV